jgi:acetyl esterase/lipase
VATTRLLHDRLVEKNVPVVMHILPQTDHAFDLILPKISPSAHNAIYDIERFLALRAAILKRPQKMDTENEEHQLYYA